MRVGLVQMDIVWEEVDENCANLKALVNASERADLYVLPELWPVGFTMNDRAWEAEPRAIAAMITLAKSKSAWVLGGVPAHNQPRQQNCAVLISPKGKETARYAKRKLFAYAGEDRYYTAGEQMVTAKVGQFPITPMICYDLRFPELAREVATATGALIYIASWPQTRRTHWQQLLIARAIENQAYAIGVNRIGSDENGLRYQGDSMVVAPSGEVVLDAGSDEGVHLCDIDYESVTQLRSRLPFLRDMS